VSGHGCAALDPFDECLEILIGEFAGGRHFEAFVADGLNEGAVGEVPGNHRGSGIAAGADEGGLVEPETAFLLVRAVAFDAVLGEEGSNLGFEEAKVRGGWRLRGRGFIREGGSGGHKSEADETGDGEYGHGIA
jgi:hypothetical protein